MKPVIILVEPQLPQNIGKTARAMLNFGLTELRLVQPAEGWLCKEARMLAAGADCVLENARCLNTFEEAIADLHRIYATSARPRDMIKDVLTPWETATKTIVNIEKNLRTGFLFGPERTGLRNDHIARADALVSIPVNPEFSSLNLAQAVVVIAFEWYQALNNTQKTTDLQRIRHDLATREEVDGFLDQLENELDKAGYFRAAGKRPLMARNLRNMFSRGDYTSQEIRTLRGVVSTLVNPNGIFSRKSMRRRETD